MATLIPGSAAGSLQFSPTHPKAEEALKWMGFEARSAIIEILDAAIADKTALVRVICYDLNDPAIVTRLEKLKKRLFVIIDDSAEHRPETSEESQAARRLIATAGISQVKRQHMSNLQHNKTIVVDGKNIKAAICGSTNFTWRGQFVQSNNAVVVKGKKAIQPFVDAFENYWENDFVKGFGPTESTDWHSLGFSDIDAKVTFSPHAKDKGVLESIGEDIRRANRLR
jgi:phosphatidylserine/phosphatidylglycerophosphate/cardiolipin synthase-like enzyme